MGIRHPRKRQTWRQDRLRVTPTLKGKEGSERRQAGATEAAETWKGKTPPHRRTNRQTDRHSRGPRHAACGWTNAHASGAEGALGLAASQLLGVSPSPLETPEHQPRKWLPAHSPAPPPVSAPPAGVGRERGGSGAEARSALASPQRARAGPAPGHAVLICLPPSQPGPQVQGWRREGSRGVGVRKEQGTVCSWRSGQGRGARAEKAGSWPSSSCPSGRKPTALRAAQSLGRGRWLLSQTWASGWQLLCVLELLGFL